MEPAAFVLHATHLVLTGRPRERDDRLVCRDGRSTTTAGDCQEETLLLAMRLAALHSFRYYRDLMEGILSALAEGRFAAFKRETLAPVAEGV